MKEKITSFLTWPSSEDNYWRPWPILLWFAIWFIPYIIIRGLLIAIVFIMAGLDAAKHIYHET